MLGCLIRLKKGEFANRLSEDHIGGVLVADDGKLMPDQRMVDNRNALVALEFHETSPSKSGKNPVSAA